MKMSFLWFVVFTVFVFCLPAGAQVGGSAPVISASPTPGPTAALAPSSAGAAPTAASVPVIAVPAPAAPPAWATDLLMTAEKLPVVGPYIEKALMYAGILSAVLTALVGFLLAAVSALAGVLNLSGLTSFASALKAFQSGQIMYYLKYFSMFNAQKPDDPAPEIKA